MKKIFLFLSIITSQFIFSQNETNNWYFGNKAALNFDKTRVNVLSDSEMNTPAGSSAISDNNGNLLFYTNGKIVWNKNHEIMENGDDLAADIDHIQSAIIIPKPNSTTNYYLFTTKSTKSVGPVINQGVYYTEIEISNTYPLGKVLFKYIQVRESSTEKITAVHHANGKDIWVITFGSLSSLPNTPFDTFMLHKIDNNGINTRIISKQKEIKSVQGGMKVSPDGKHIAIADFEGRYIYLYSFDNDKGKINFKEKISTDLFGIEIPPYGIEFSPNSRFMYFTSGALIFQYDVQKQGPVLEGYKKTIAYGGGTSKHSLQLAKNGKILVAQTTYDGTSINFIGSIDYPNKKGILSNFKKIHLKTSPGLSTKGLPNFIQSYFRNRIITENKCVYTPFEFSLDSYAPIDNVTWDFGDGNTSINKNPSHNYTQPGTYTVTATISFNNQIQNLYKKITVYPLPELYENKKLIQCDNDNDGKSLFNLNNIAPKISDDDTLTYTFFHNLIDAQNEQNEIQDPINFYNQTNPQTIYTKANTIYGCSKIESFTIESLFTQPSTISPIVECETADNTNLGVFNLIKKKNEINKLLNLNKQYILNFYPSYEDAQKSTNKLPELFESPSTTIWIKIENENECSGISPIKLTLNKLPYINLKENYTICVNPETHPPVTLSIDNTVNRVIWKDEMNNTISVSKNFTLTKTGNYSVTVFKNENGIECSNSKTFNVTNPNPPKIIELNLNTENQQENTVFISVNGNSQYEFSIDNINYFGLGTSYTFNNVKPGIVTVYVRDINKCEAIVNEDISIIGYSKFLTPNDDTKNDKWLVYGANTNHFKLIGIKIFNRFGKILYTINNDNASLGWNGKYNGKPMPSGEYWFHAKLIDLNDKKIEKKGHFALIRR